MISNCFIGEQTLDASNLTNDIYIQLIEVLLKFYTIHYSEAQTHNQSSDQQSTYENYSDKYL